VEYWRDGRCRLRVRKSGTYGLQFRVRSVVSLIGFPVLGMIVGDDRPSLRSKVAGEIDVFKLTFGL
jgi:hypothetical protein